MEVIFRTRQLRRNYEDPSRAVMDWGHAVGRRYADLVDSLYDAADFRQLYDVSPGQSRLNMIFRNVLMSGD
ncbi:MAG: hypothetical protein OXL37_04315, partial [Chloroflexota bacterium]|nr:hypothetical protein [Chloroflexota bacterium]